VSANIGYYVGTCDVCPRKERKGLPLKVHFSNKSYCWVDMAQAHKEAKTHQGLWGVSSPNSYPGWAAPFILLIFLGKRLQQGAKMAP